jgi:uncharacterized membrane protein YidH (DUF202 family)
MDQPSGVAVSPRSLAVTRSAALLITMGIALASFVLSFTALTDLAVRAGIPKHLAWLWPLIVDGTIVQATMAVVSLAGLDGQERNRRYFWIVLSTSAAFSVVANGWHAVLPGGAPLSPWLAAAIAVVAPVSLLASTHGLSLLIRVSTPRRATSGMPEAPPESAPTPRPEPVVAVDAEVPPSPPSPLALEVLRPWADVADVIAGRESSGAVDADTVAAVLHLSYERDMSPKAIGGELGVDLRQVCDIVASGDELIRSGDVRVERVAV